MKVPSTIAALVVAAGHVLGSHIEVRPYGFIKADFYLATDGVVSWGTPALTSVSGASGLDSTAIGFTAQHSRFGLDLRAKVGGIPVGGVAEIDFWVIASNFNAMPRMRQAYLRIRPIDRLSVDIGQRWDIFSPLNPVTNNTNANLWMNGNYGFRRPQVAIRYVLDRGELVPVFELSVGEAGKEDQTRLVVDEPPRINTDRFLGRDNLSMVPLFEGRVGLLFFEDFTAGLGALTTAYGNEQDFFTWGLGLDAQLPFHRLASLMGEFVIGTNLDNADLFTIGGNGSADNDVRTYGFWLNLISRPFEHFHGVLGLARERVYSGAIPGRPETNTTFYTTILFPLGDHVTFAAEYQFFSTDLEGREANHTAGLFDVAGKLVF